MTLGKLACNATYQTDTLAFHPASFCLRTDSVLPSGSVLRVLQMRRLWLMCLRKETDTNRQYLLDCRPLSLMQRLLSPSMGISSDNRWKATAARAGFVRYFVAVASAELGCQIVNVLPPYVVSAVFSDDTTELFPFFRPICWDRY